MILASKIVVLQRFFSESGFALPHAYRAILGHPDRLPRHYADVFTDPSKIVAFNLILREKGWFNSPGWPDSYLAIGEDPGGNVLYFDANSGDDAVWLADHETTLTAKIATECEGMERQADSFADYIAQAWRRFLEEEGELPVESQGTGSEFELLRHNPHPLLLENYFEDAAIPYEVFEAWKLPLGDYHLFFDIGNLTTEAAQHLVVPAAEIAARQQTYGRFRAAIGLMHRLLEKAELKRIPRQGALAATQILKLGTTFALEDYDSWNAVKGRLKTGRTSRPS